MNVVYAGIGSRQTPKEVIALMEKLGATMARQGFILRSGGAPGADQAFERGCDRAHGRKVIYLPWEKFEGNKSPLFEVSEEAMDIARQIHPAWDKCSDGVRRLLSRNVYQMLGLDLNYPARFAICWTDHSTGGTDFALQIAEEYDIPFFNMADHDDDEVMTKLAQFIQEN